MSVPKKLSKNISQDIPGLAVRSTEVSVLVQNLARPAVSLVLVAGRVDDLGHFGIDQPGSQDAVHAGRVELPLFGGQVQLECSFDDDVFHVISK